MKIELDFLNMKNEKSFHTVFKKVMGFPKFYGMNGDAWIDCMSCIDEKDNKMTMVNIQPGESLDIFVFHIEYIIQNNSKLFLNFMELVACVNQRFKEDNKGTNLNVIVF